MKSDYAEAIAERASQNGLYEPPSGMEGIYIAVVRLIVQEASRSLALARRKVFVIGDAERMVSQEGSEQAANAFLKLLEEPPADTFFILTSSEAGALLPTIRSRVASLRVAPLTEAPMREFLADETVAERLEEEELPSDTKEILAIAAGAPGRLLAGAAWRDALESARRLLEAALSPSAAARYEAAWHQGISGARGVFSDTLDALTVALAERAREAASGGHALAAAAARAMEAVEIAKERTLTNVNPQLITARLVRDIHELLG